MKPRTQLEKKAEAASKKIKDTLTDAQFRWACEHCFEHYALMRRRSDNQFICMECGETFDLSETTVTELDAVVNETVVRCPHCGRQLKVKVSPKRKNGKKAVSSMQILSVMDGLQVLRTIYMEQWTYPDSEAHYYAHECVRRFITPNDKEVVMARNRKGMSFYIDVFDYNSPLTIKKENDAYSLGPNEVYPRMKVLPILTRNGWSKKLCGSWNKQYVSPLTGIRRLLKSSKYETIVKAKRYDIWYHLGDYYNMNEVQHIWPQLKLIIRHNYHVGDFNMWIDTIDMARTLNLDIHSPKYLMPENLAELHDTLMTRLAERERRKKEAERRERIRSQKEWEHTYQEVFGKLLGFELTVGDINIQPLHNYDEFCDEGDKMHHCVESYWKHKDSYILSVKSNGERLATVELSMKDFHIKQCRGVCNKVPPRFDEICGLLNAHQAEFMKLKPRKKGVQHESV